MIRRLLSILPSLLAVLVFVTVFAILSRPASAVLTLDVQSEHGTPVPAGNTEYEFGDSVDLSVDSVLIIDVNTRIICTGWVGTGSIPATGDTNSLHITIYVNSSLTWTWSYEYTLKIYNPQNLGTSNPQPGIYRFTEGSVINGSIPNFIEGYVAAGFTGTGSAPASSDNPFFEITLNEPTTVTWHWEEAGFVPATNWGDSSTSLTIFGEDKFAQLVVDPLTSVQRIFYYEPVQGDLMLAYFNGVSWINGIIDSSGDVGKYLKVIVAPSGEYHVAYYDATNGYLKYAYSANGFTWNTKQLVDIYNDAGHGLDMQLDGSGQPWIAYFAPGLSELRITYRIGETWQATDVVSDNVGNSTYISLAFDETTLTFIVAYFEGLSKSARYASYVDSAWVINDIPAQFDSGMHMVCSVNSKGQPFFCYQELSQAGRKDLKLIYNSAGKWYFTPLSTTGDSGYFNKISFNILGFPVVHTFDRNASQIRQYSWTGDDWVVVNCSDEVAFQPFGLTVDKDNTPILFYFEVDALKQRKPAEADGTGGSEVHIAGGGSGCFIATAAFGSLASSEVVKLTSWRDSNLISSSCGSSLLNVYYATSPAIAAELSGSPAARCWISRMLSK